MENYKTLQYILSNLNMTHHFNKFKEQEFDDDCLSEACESDLKELGLSIGERRKFLSSIKIFYSIQRIEDQLATFYRHEDFVSFRRIDKTRLSLESCYVNLSVIPMDKHNNAVDTKGFKASESDFSRSSEELLKSVDFTCNCNGNENLRLVQLSNLFSRNKMNLNWENVKQKRILIFGKAGIGKTTLCKKIVYDYYKKNLWKNYFHRVIWLALRDLKQMTKPGDKVHAELSDVYTYRFFNRKEDGIALSNAITKEEEENKKILFILDGWDEIGELLADGHWMKNVLLDQLLKKPFLIVTSRPYTMGLESCDFDDVLETIGFTRENIFQYIKIVLPSDGIKQNKVLNFINSHRTIVGMASIPIQLDMICYLCSNIEDLEKCFNTETVTMTKLYDVLVKKMLDLNQIRKSGSLTFEWISDTYKNIFSSHNSENCSQLKFLAEVAYNAFLQNQIEFSDKFFPSSSVYSLEIRNEAKESYFLNCLNPSETAPEKKSYTYIHLTFQEFLAALHIVHAMKKDELAVLVSKYKYNPRFKTIWSFVAGLIEDSKELDMYFNYLERSPIEITGIPHQILMLTCISECDGVLDEKRMTRLLDEFMKWPQSTGVPSWIIPLQFPNKFYDDKLSWIFDPEKKNLHNFEKYLSSCHFLPESIMLRIFDGIFLEAVVNDEQNWMVSIIEKVQNIVELKHGFIGVKTIIKIETHLNDIIQFLNMEKNEDKRRKALSWTRLLINILVDCDVNDSICNCLLNLFNTMLGEQDKNESRAVLIIISKVVGNSRSQCKDELIQKLTDLLINPTSPDIRMVAIDCFRNGGINNLPEETQIILAEFLVSIPGQVLIYYLQSQKDLHFCVIEKLMEYVETHPNFELRYKTLQILSSQNHLPEEIINRLIDVFQSTNDSKLRLNIFSLFMCPDIITDAVATKLLAQLNEEELLKFEFLNAFSTNPDTHQRYLNEDFVPVQLIQKLGEFFNTYCLQGKHAIAITILICLKRFQQIPENMRPYLCLYVKSKNRTISEMKTILESLKYQCALCHMHGFSPLLVNIALNNDLLVEPIINIFKNHQHLFNTEEMGNFFLTCKDNDRKFIMVIILSHCENVPSELLFKIIEFLMDMNNSEQLFCTKYVMVLTKLLENQISLPKSVLTYVLNFKNWTWGRKYLMEVPGMVRNFPLSKVLDTLDEDNWERVFDHVISRRLTYLLFSPIPVIQIVEEKNKLAILTAAENEPQEINHLDLSLVVNKLRQEKLLPQRPDPLTLFLKFHSKPESLFHIQKLPMDFEMQKMDLLIHTNLLRKYFKLFLYKENLTKEDFDILFQEIKIKLENCDFLHLDLRDNHLTDKNIFSLKECLRNSQKKISTLILSNNQITCGKDGLRSLLDKSFCDKIGLKFLYLDRNNIYLTQVDFDTILRNSNSLLEESGLEILDLSGNFIPEGRLGRFNDNILAPRHILLSSGLSIEELETNVRFIKSSSVLNSCEVVDESFSFTPIHNQFYYLKPDLECPQRISKSVGCIILAYAKSSILFKHAFFGIDWVPPNQCDNFGQRQLIRSELVVNRDDKSLIRIKIFQIPPTKFVSDFGEENVKIRGVIFAATEKISKFLAAIYRSRDTVNIYEYKLLASSSSSSRGQFNCITWADIMLQQIGITLNTMKTSCPLLIN